jgi:hypothetical protein
VINPRFRGVPGAIGVAVLAAVLLSVAAVAWADTRTIKDKRGDARGCRPACNDVRSVTATHKGGYLYYRFLHYRFRKRAGNVLVFIETPRNSFCGYTAQWGDPYRDLKPDVVDRRGSVSGDCTGNKRVGRLIVGRPNSKTITFKFSPRAIGSPRRYRWRAFSGFDFVPNAVRGKVVWVRHTLR